MCGRAADSVRVANNDVLNARKLFETCSVNSFKSNSITLRFQFNYKINKLTWAHTLHMQTLICKWWVMAVVEAGAPIDTKSN